MNSEQWVASLYSLCLSLLPHCMYRVGQKTAPPYNFSVDSAAVFVYIYI